MSSVKDCIPNEFIDEVNALFDDPIMSPNEDYNDTLELTKFIKRMHFDGRQMQVIDTDDAKTPVEIDWDYHQVIIDANATRSAQRFGVYNAFKWIIKQRKADKANEASMNQLLYR